MTISKSIIDKSIKGHIKNNPWKNTLYEDYYFLGNRTKGTVSEIILENILKDIFNLNVTNRTNEGHDRIVNNIKTEFKFSLATERNFKHQYMFNHVALEKDWDRIIFCGVNGDLEVDLVWFTKDEIKKLLNDPNYFTHQQGGNKSQNDDYLSSGLKSSNLITHLKAKNMGDF